MLIQKIISGGQTGANRAGLDWAIDASKDGMRYVVNADDILAGFLELEVAINEHAGFL